MTANASRIFMPLERCLYGVSTKSLELGEGDDLVETFVDLASGHPVQARGEGHVVAHGEVVDEPAGDLDERGDAAVHLHVALVGEHHLRDELQEGRLALPVAADHPDRLARRHA